MVGQYGVVVTLSDLRLFLSTATKSQYPFRSVLILCAFHKGFGQVSSILGADRHVSWNLFAG